MLQDVGTTGAESAPGGSMDGGLNVDDAAVPSDTEETGDSAGLPGNEATMAKLASDTSSIMGKRSEQLAGRNATHKGGKGLLIRVSKKT